MEKLFWAKPQMQNYKSEDLEAIIKAMGSRVEAPTEAKLVFDRDGDFNVYLGNICLGKGEKVECELVGTAWNSSDYFRFPAATLGELKRLVSKATKTAFWGKKSVPAKIVGNMASKKLAVVVDC